MKILPRPKTKNSDLHIRLSLANHDTLRKISLLKNTTITKIIEEHINTLQSYHNI
jgi:hypothetical protein